jgi:hypothetical protein
MRIGKSKIAGKEIFTRYFTNPFPYQGKERMGSGKKKYQVLSVKKIPLPFFLTKWRRAYI